MVDEGFKRKLAAILSADAVEYSRLMGEDEEATVRTLKAYREILCTLIGQHNGKVLDSTGDNLLAEFVSVVDAVQCGVAVQKEIKARNDSLPENRRMQFRIGINLGDVIQEEGRIYGDGVNIASRLEGLSEPGGICISKTVFDHIESKLPYGYEFLGDQTVKNIARPVGAYRVMMHPRITTPEQQIDEKKPISQRGPFPLWAVVVIVIMAGFLIWQFYINRVTVETASIEKMANPLNDKPSIAVLPFNNLSNDPEQEYFSDGMTDDIITDLSKISGLMFISSNSIFTYKGKEIKIPAIAQELGVKYVLEGSIRRAGNEVRINAQLIDAVTDHHIWADRFDGSNESIFALQDKITERIVSALAVKLSASEQKETTEKGTDNIIAYDTFLKGMSHLRKFTPKDYVKAIEYFEKAIKLDPNYSDAYANLAYLYLSALDGGKKFWDEIGINFVTARLLARHYVEKAMKNPTSRGYQAMAIMELFKRNFKEAIDFAEHAVSISPNDADAFNILGRMMVFAGKPEEGMKYYKRSIMLDPLHKSTGGIGFAYFVMEDYEQAIKYIEKHLKDYPEQKTLGSMLASSYAFLGNNIKAKKALEEFFN